ncbi:MAG: Zn-dependent hydrolase [Haloquadratum walsbyi J07HQW1]|jgi:glyoxylase-like metal-dependent hydrolase (beta-lactamase superfamily II)|uniref:Zn-dependent hydrolase n=1 Tax=Haloquadratum walsbyi J07HQW1 TaxID=1238424 RepID=U1PJE4_9EURY|nr:MAG: Zn-dependent hydrolase [Haloquadratum walsbyi J07HQW1]
MIQNIAGNVRAFTSNVFLVTGETTALIDAGSNFDVIARIQEHTEQIDRLYLTHTHVDHIENVPSVRDAFSIETWGYDTTHDVVDHAIQDEELVPIGDETYMTLHTPGHKPDHLCFYAADIGICFGGDLIFANGSFGRTDLEGGDRKTLIQSIDRLSDVVTDDLTTIYVGHGPAITSDPQEEINLAAQAARLS